MFLSFKYYHYFGDAQNSSWISEYWWILVLVAVAIIAIVFAVLFFMSKRAKYIFVTVYKNGIGEQMQILRGSTFNPDIPTREGYAFRGWYLDSACTTPWLSTYKVKKPMALYPKWEKE
jgi:uncharacterized repeat protein (TIGR02543 family)